MSIQFKSITELRAMLDDKLISPLELTQESHQLANKFKELKIPLPSLEIQEQCITLFEQKEAYIESIDKKIAEHKNYLEELKTLAKDVITSFC